jgi:hypothetical protein
MLDDALSSLVGMNDGIAGKYRNVRGFSVPPHRKQTADRWCINALTVLSDLAPKLVSVRESTIVATLKVCRHETERLRDDDHESYAIHTAT